MKEFPYLPTGRQIQYVSVDNQYMQAAKKAAEKFSTDDAHPTGAVIVKNNEILGAGGNYSWFHKQFSCIRKLLKAPTGKMYGLCPGCNPKTHAEAQAIRAAKKSGHFLIGADLYLWGHWWCCKSCWNRMIKVGIKNVYLAQDAETLFRK